MSSRRERIIARIMKRVRVDPITGCWEWTGPTSGKKGRGRNYPRMCLDGQTVAVHRVMWTCVHGYLPGKKQIDHECRNRLCVNPHPGHTEMVTHKRNCRRRDKARKLLLAAGEPPYSPPVAFGGPEHAFLGERLQRRLLAS